LALQTRAIHFIYLFHPLCERALLTIVDACPLIRQTNYIASDAKPCPLTCSTLHANHNAAHTQMQPTKQSLQLACLHSSHPSLIWTHHCLMQCPHSLFFYGHRLTYIYITHIYVYLLIGLPVVKPEREDIRNVRLFIVICICFAMGLIIIPIGVCIR
jgi:hypothetical protein